MDVDDSLVNAHLEAVPGLGALTAGRLTGRDSQNLRGNAHGALGLVALVLRTGNDLGARALQGLRVSASQSHSIKQQVRLRLGPPLARSVGVRRRERT